VDALGRFTEIVRGPETAVPLDEAVLLVAADAHPDLDLVARRRELDALAAEAPSDDPDAIAGVLFRQRGFRGNTEDYGDPRNSYLDDVLDRRTGLPITLAVLMMEVGRRRGVRLHGVGLPGHFLVGAFAPDGRHLFFDAFSGGARLGPEACLELFARMHPHAEFRPDLLRPVGPFAILDRILTNLQHSLLAREPAAALWPVRLRLRIPDRPALQRAELASMLGRLGASAEAAAVLEELAPHLPAAERARTRRAATWLRARDN
jgi:regulator of sirC expression with transglutaminase-like and TPR domain